jgi:uncharacterized protein YicC (UPF0701 family)
MRGNGVDDMENKKEKTIVEAAENIIELLKKEKFSEGKELTKSTENKLDEIIDIYASKWEE